jgi:hypothetical protein
MAYSACRQAEIEQWQQALAAGENLAVSAELSQQFQRLSS